MFEVNILKLYYEMRRGKLENGILCNLLGHKEILSNWNDAKNTPLKVRLDFITGILFGMMKYLNEGRTYAQFTKELFNENGFKDCKKIKTLEGIKEKLLRGIKVSEIISSGESEEDVSFVSDLNLICVDLMLTVDMIYGLLSKFIWPFKSAIFTPKKMEYLSQVLEITEIHSNNTKVKINRFHLDSDRSLNNLSFIQLYNSLKNVNSANLRTNPASKDGIDVAFSVRFTNESGVGDDGPYRELLEVVFTEIYSETNGLNMFHPTPNLNNNIGNDRYIFIPIKNQSDEKKKWLRFVGILIGVAFRGRILAPLYFPNLFYRILTQQTLNREDLSQIDFSFCKSFLEAFEEVKNDEEFDKLHVDVYFEEKLRGFVDETLIGKRVSFGNRMEYVEGMEKWALEVEFGKRFEEICKGFWEIIPKKALKILTAEELCFEICGSPKIVLKLLKEFTRYKNCKEEDKVVKNFWETLEHLSENELSLFAEFVYASSRLPSTREGFENRKIRMLLKLMKVDDGKSADNMFPLSETCFFNITLPPYSSQKVMERQLRKVLSLSWGMSGDGPTQNPLPSTQHPSQIENSRRNRLRSNAQSSLREQLSGSPLVSSLSYQTLVSDLDDLFAYLETNLLSQRTEISVEVADVNIGENAIENRIEMVSETMNDNSNGSGIEDSDEIVNENENEHLIESVNVISDEIVNEDENENEHLIESVNIISDEIVNEDGMVEVENEPLSLDEEETDISESELDCREE